jgi:hypothetical protein
MIHNFLSVPWTNIELSSSMKYFFPNAISLCFGFRWPSSSAGCYEPFAENFHQAADLEFWESSSIAKSVRRELAIIRGKE